APGLSDRCARELHRDAGRRRVTAFPASVETWEQPNGSRLSCGRDSGWRKAAGRPMELVGEVTQFFPTGERPSGGSTQARDRGLHGNQPTSGQSRDRADGVWALDNEVIVLSRIPHPEMRVGQPHLPGFLEAVGFLSDHLPYQNGGSSGAKLRGVRHARRERVRADGNDQMPPPIELRQPADRLTEVPEP